MQLLKKEVMTREQHRLDRGEISTAISEYVMRQFPGAQTVNVMIRVVPHEAAVEATVDVTRPEG